MKPEYIERIIKRLLEENRTLPSKFYHGSSRQLKVGMILGGKSFKSMFGDAEKILEMFRPPEMASRLSCVYMVSKPSDVDIAGGEDDHVYLMEPIGEVHAHHGGWLGDIYDYAMDNADDLTMTGPKLSKSSMKKAVSVPAVIKMAQNYWNGVPRKNKPGSVWEYLANRAKIVKAVK